MLASKINGLNVLFETGIGAFFPPQMRDRYGVTEPGHKLLENLSQAGFRQEDIGCVVLSHLHFDHAGGLLTEYQEGVQPRLLFPNAKYVVGKEAWNRALRPHSRDRASFIPELNQLLIDSGRLEIVDGNTSPTLGNQVRFHYSDGHTPGLMLAEVLGAEGRGGIVFCGDLIPGRPWVHIPVTMGYDRAPELLIDEKKRFLDNMIGRGVRLFFTHDDTCATSMAAVDGKGKYAPADEIPMLAGLALN